MIKSSDSNTFFANAYGNYSAVISYSSNCSDSTNLISVIVNTTTGTNENFMSDAFLNIYLNPANGVVTFEYLTINDSVLFEIQIYNVRVPDKICSGVK